MKDLSGKTAVITGGASGIGLAMAELFAAQGMKIVLGDIEAEALTAAIDKLSASGAACTGTVTDVSDPDAVQALADLAVEHFGGIHIACNNAGVFTGGLLWEESLADYRWLMDVNVMGVVHGIRSFVPIMQAQGDECHIVNTASMAAVTAMPYSGIYHMSKHAVLALSESLYHELSFHSPQVKISVLCPEAINTGIATSERNRHTHYSEVVESDERTMVMDALNASVAGGIGPQVMAQRVLDAVINERFYILSDEVWRRSAETRLEDIHLGRNPTFAPPIPE